MKITAEFVSSAASAADLRTGDEPEVALVGRSNVGKSSVLNALAGRRLARTSAQPGKTRLANLYRVERGAAGRLWLVDLPGFGYAGGGRKAAEEFDTLTRAYFGRGKPVAALFLVDARHPGLASDRQAWAWLRSVVTQPAVVVTKIDKLARGERIRALAAHESVFEDSVLPVSAVTAEGLDDLWILINRLTSPHSPPRSSPPHTRRRR